MERMQESVRFVIMIPTSIAAEERENRPVKGEEGAQLGSGAELPKPPD